MTQATAEPELSVDQLSHYRRLLRQGWKPQDALRIAGGPMGGVSITLAGLDSGADGFMRNRVETDGCPDQFTRSRVKRNNGGSIGGGFFVPGLCRPGVPFDSFAVCHSRDEVIKKAQKLGVAVRGPGINVDPREQAPVVDDGVPSEKAMKLTIMDEVRNKHGGKVTRKKYREIVTELQDRHRRKDPPRAKKIDRIFPEGT